MSGLQLPANFGGRLILPLPYAYILANTTPNRVEYLVVVTALGSRIHGRNMANRRRNTAMRLSDQELIRLRRAFVQGDTTTAIAADFDVNIATVNRWRRNLVVFGSISAPRSVVQGRPRLLTRAQTEVGVVSVMRVVCD
jgi:transposase-like protein